MILLFPIGVDVAMDRWPWMNWIIMALTVFATFYGWLDGGPNEDFFVHCVANGPYFVGHLLHPLAHGGIVHLVGNMVFLWAFGNAICAKVGNLWYPLVYFGGGFIASLLTAIVHPAPAIGASGAINVIVGMFLVWYGRNAVQMFYVFIIRGGVFEITAYWLVLTWCAYDIWGALGPADGVGHSAHLAGLLVGVVFAVLLVKSGLLELSEDERSLYDGLRNRIVRTGRGAASVVGAARRISPTTLKSARSAKDAPPPRPRPRPRDDDPIPLADAPDKPREKRFE